jgi:hypothetical protein
MDLLACSGLLIGLSLLVIGFSRAGHVLKRS